MTFEYAYTPALDALSESGHLQTETEALRNLLFQFYCRGELDEAQKDPFNRFYFDHLEEEYESYQAVCDNTKHAYFAIGQIEGKPGLSSGEKQALIQRVLTLIDSCIVHDIPFDQSGA